MPLAQINGLLPAIWQDRPAAKGGCVNRVLLVNPDARERRTLGRALTLEGYAVLTASDSREAVRLFITQPIALLLVSRSEPGLDSP